MESLNKSLKLCLFVFSVFVLWDAPTGTSVLFATDEGTVPAPSRQTGDVTEGGGSINLTDVIYLLNWLYLGGDEPIQASCAGAVPSEGSDGFEPRFLNGNPGNTADVNGDGSLDITDPIHLVNFLFAGGPAPVQMACIATETAV